MKCPICGKGEFVTLRDRTNHFLCLNCGHVIHNEIDLANQYKELLPHIEGLEEEIKIIVKVHLKLRNALQFDEKHSWDNLISTYQNVFDFFDDENYFKVITEYENEIKKCREAMESKEDAISVFHYLEALMKFYLLRLCELSKISCESANHRRYSFLEWFKKELSL